MSCLKLKTKSKKKKIRNNTVYSNLKDISIPVEDNVSFSLIISNLKILNKRNLWFYFIKTHDYELKQ